MTLTLRQSDTVGTHFNSANHSPLANVLASKTTNNFAWEGNGVAGTSRNLFTYDKKFWNYGMFYDLSHGLLDKVEIVLTPVEKEDKNARSGKEVRAPKSSNRR